MEFLLILKMGVVQCCSKDKENPKELLSSKQEEERREEEIEKSRIQIIEKYKWHESKVKLIQSFVRMFRFRRTLKNNLKLEKNRAIEYLRENEMFIDESIDFDSLMHPLVSKSYKDFSKKRGVFSKKEIYSELSSQDNYFKYSDQAPDQANPDHFYSLLLKPIWLNKDKQIAYKGKWNIQLKPQGFGHLIKTDGSRYEGFFMDGKLHGYGRYFTPKGEFFQGEFIHGVASGRGIFVHPDANVYIGEWHNDKTDGDGTEYFQDGSIFVGKFKNGKKNGKGLYSWVDGSKYDGYFKDDLLHGFGHYIWSDNSQYKGEWRNNLMNGKGAFTFADGSLYEGDFVNNKRSGNGKYIWSTTKYHIGGWKDGKQHGRGKYFKEGKIVEGLWNEGRFIG